MAICFTVTPYHVLPNSESSLTENWKCGIYPIFRKDKATAYHLAGTTYVVRYWNTPRVAPLLDKILSTNSILLGALFKIITPQKCHFGKFW